MNGATKVCAACNDMLVIIDKRGSALTVESHA